MRKEGLNARIFNRSKNALMPYECILSQYLLIVRSYSDVSICFIESVFRNLIVVARKQGRIVTCTLVHTHVYLRNYLIY